MALSDHDLLNIQALLARFVHALDAGDPVTWTNCFAPEGIYRDASQTLTGREAILPFITQVMTEGDAGPNPKATPRLVHLATPPRIEGDGDRATAHSYWQALTEAKDGSVVIWRVGEFRDQLIKRDDEWLFQERHIPSLLGKARLSDL
ncbi:MAG: nuclear transport factor 2 family protein [Chloroflexi bacterium]|nr:nuclear transport factor 2 family protein [Chloroflexota bacterium]